MPVDALNGGNLLTVHRLTAPTLATVNVRSTTPPLPLFSDITLHVDAGEILVIQGPSGAGKSVLLKCIAHLLVWSEGNIRLKGRQAIDYGIPDWRVRVLYLPQRPALLPGTPLDFLKTVKSYKARKQYWQQRFGNSSGRNVDPVDIAQQWLVEEACWNKTWNNLSGGEAQRIALAIGLALDPEVLLLDGEINLGYSLDCNTSLSEPRVFTQSQPPP